MSARVLKWSVPVDDEIHVVGSGKVVKVGSQGGAYDVCVWTIEYGENPVASREVMIVGTGHYVPEGDWEHIGSAIAPPFVWHLFERVPF